MTAAVSRAAVVLAAGAGTRFEGSEHKLRAEVDGESVLQRSVGAAITASIGPVIVVVGSDPFDDLLFKDVVVVAAQDWSEGQSRSLQTGLAAVRATGAQEMVIGLADMPWVTSQAWRAVAAKSGQLVVASYGGQRMPPVKISEELWPELPTVGDFGARDLFVSHKELLVEVPVDGDGRDIDSEADLAR